MDSPSGMFYVNISHTASSQYDAYDVNITDFIEGMNIIRDNDFPGIEISTPTDNTYKLSSNIPVIAGKMIIHLLQHCLLILIRYWALKILFSLIFYLIFCPDFL